MFKGMYKIGDQIFYLRNVYLIILLFIDQEPSKKIKFGDLRMKIKTAGGQSKKKNRSEEL